MDGDTTRDLEQWRLEQLLALRMPPELAATLVEIPDVAHVVEALVGAGCDVVTAWEIVAEE